MLAFAASTQFSIAAAQILLTVASALGIVLVIRDRERIEVPRMFWPLAVYAVMTLIAAAFSIAPEVSLWDSKQLLLFVVVPLAYRLFRGRPQLYRRRCGDYGRCAARDVRRHPVRRAQLRQSRAARAGSARSLHDLFGRHHAGGLHRGGAADIQEAGPHVACSRAAGSPRRAGPDDEPQCLGRRLRRHRAAVPAPGLPSGGITAGSGGAVPGFRADAAERSALLDLQLDRSVQP